MPLSFLSSVLQEVKPTGILEPLFAGGMERFYGASGPEEHRKRTLRTRVVASSDP